MPVTLLQPCWTVVTRNVRVHPQEGSQNHSFYETQVCTKKNAQKSSPAESMSRRALIAGVVTFGALCFRPEFAEAALWTEGQNQFVNTFSGAVNTSMIELSKNGKLDVALEKAYSVQNDSIALEQAWTECIAIAPKNASTWSSRGAARLTLKKYAEALEDLEKARDLEASSFGYPTSSVLVPLGTAKGALGNWEGAIADFEEALMDPSGIPSVALTSAALAKFELGQSQEAVQTAQQALEDDPDSQDIKAVLAGMLWAVGNKAAAQASCKALGGTDVLKSLVAMQQAADGWSPSVIASVNAFLDAP